HRPGGEVHVDVGPVRTRLDAEGVSVRTHVGEGDAGRLLHHVAELAGDSQVGRSGLVLVFGRQGRHLDEQHVASGSGDRQTGGHAGYRYPVGDVGVVEPSTAQVIGN